MRKIDAAMFKLRYMRVAARQHSAAQWLRNRAGTRRACRPYMTSLRTRKRRGASAIELILVLIVLVLATFVSLQFGIALIVKQAVAQASIVAAREAAKGASSTELSTVIERVLAGHQITIGSNASFVLEDPDPEPQQGTLPCTPPLVPLIDGDEVRVTVCVSLTAHPILNILQVYGVDFTGRTFSISSVATRE
jgi:TadE-like protein